MTRSTLPHAAASVSMALALFAVGCSGCTGGDKPATPSTPGTPAAESGAGAGAAPAAAVDPAKAATITGKVKLDGAPPAAEPIQMEADPKCHAAHGGAEVKSESYVVKDGMLANVIVYVKEGLTGNFNTGESAPPATLDQKGCMYAPHVIVMQTGQKLTIKNSDPTTHNVHALPKKDAKAEFNEGQPAGAGDLVKKFKMAEIVRVKCDIHAWMGAWIGTFDHPFAAVTGPDGSFEIKGLPPGKYKLEAWHEKLKTQEMEVTVGEKETKTVDFTYKIQ